MSDGPAPRRVDVAGWQVDVVGTAHISHASVAQVGALVDQGGYDLVALELCAGRFDHMLNPSRVHDIDLMQALRSGRAGMIAATLALSATQQRMATRLEIEPGAELRHAADRAEVHGIPVALVDRDVNTTLRRAYASLSFWQRLQVAGGLVASVFGSPEVSAREVEDLKDGDLLQNLFAEVAAEVPGLYRTLVEERDRYMAARLRQELAAHRGRCALLVVGAGHVPGVVQALGEAPPPGRLVEELDAVPPRSTHLSWLAWVVALVILMGFAYGFSLHPDLGWTLVREWVVINGSLSALGALLAGGHALTVATAFLAAPLTSLNPTVGAGMVAGAAELVLRRPKVGEFASLRGDVAELAGWRRNGVARVLAVFVLASLGSALGTYVAGFRLVDRLFL